MKKITRARIIGELVDKFSLVEFDKEDFLFGELVVPTYDIGPHVKTWVAEESRIAITENGNEIFFTVPENERWYLRRVDVINETGANFGINEVFLYTSATKHQFLFLDWANPLTSGTAELIDISQDLPMEKGGLEKLSLNIVDFVAGGYVSVNILKEVEIIR